MSYRDVMRLPICTFWMMSAQINRVRAEGELRQLNIVVSGGSAEGAKETRERLLEEMGTVATGIDTHWERDEEGFEGLRQLAGML